MGVDRHVGDCLLRLGMVALKDNFVHEAKKHFESAKELYITAEDHNGATFCEMRLICHHGQECPSKCEVSQISVDSILC